MTGKWFDFVALVLALGTVACVQFLPEFSMERELRLSDVCCYLGFSACVSLAMTEVLGDSKSRSDIQVIQNVRKQPRFFHISIHFTFYMLFFVGSSTEVFCQPCCVLWIGLVFQEICLLGTYGWLQLL